MKNNKNILMIEWVKLNHPELYNATLLKMTKDDGLGVPWAAQGKYKPVGGGAFSRARATTVKASPPTPDWADKFAGFMGSMAPQLLKLKQQRDIMKMQMKRARRGLPPANVADYTPVIRTSIDIGEDTRRAMAQEARAGISKIAVPAGITAAVILVGFLAMRKR